MDLESFREALLGVMERKDHWAWSAFGDGTVPKEELHLHFEQEWEVYVRDFPVLIGRAYVQCPHAVVRRELAENLYEEETGGIAAGKPHPELFLQYPKGLGFDLSRFERVELIGEALTYRDFLDDASGRQGWDVGAAVTTLFIEGTKYERGEIDERAKKRPAPPLEEHPLVKHYGLPIADLALTKAHRGIEGEHRAAAWRILLGEVEPSRRALVVAAMETALARWLAYRDGVARACGLVRSQDGRPARR